MTTNRRYPGGMVGGVPAFNRANIEHVERSNRALSFTLSPTVQAILEFDDFMRVQEVYPSLRHVRGDRYDASESDARAILDTLRDRASADGGYEHVASDRRALARAAKGLGAALDAAADAQINNRDCGGDPKCLTHRGGSHNMLSSAECRR